MSRPERERRQDKVLAIAQRRTLAEDRHGPGRLVGVKNKDGYDRDQFHRPKARRDAKTATCAVAASMLAPIYHRLKSAVEHHDLGVDHVGKR